MTVRKSERSESKLEVQYQAIRLHDELCDLSYRCFGVYSRNNPLRSKHAQMLRRVEDPDRIDRIIFNHQDKVESYAEDIVNFIYAANSIFPRTREDMETRLMYQDKALSTCGMVKGELNSIARMFDCDISVFKVSNELLNTEINLIKSWRKSDKLRFKNLIR